MFRNKAARGFTVIELLVVISIIGMLATVVLVSLKNTRGKAINARIAAEMYELRTQLEIGYNGTAYGDFIPVGTNNNTVLSYVAANVFTNPAVTNLINNIVSLSPGTSYGGGETSSSVLDCGGISGNYHYYTVSGAPSGSDTNSLSIFVYPACGPVTKFAIYGKFPDRSIASIPFIKYALAVGIGGGGYQPGTVGTGYYCIDSSGKIVTNTAAGSIPYNNTSGVCY
jgi:prepilin-type N-terminal cleavage/methylation domain-containing protein